jgi:hypothetical protein
MSAASSNPLPRTATDTVSSLTGAINPPAAAAASTPRRQLDIRSHFDSDAKRPTAVTPDGFQVQQHHRRRSTSPPQQRRHGPSLPGAAPSAHGKDEQRLCSSDRASERTTTSPRLLPPSSLVPVSNTYGVLDCSSSSSSSSSGVAASDSAQQLLASASAISLSSFGGLQAVDDSSCAIIADADSDSDVAFDSISDEEDVNDADMSTTPSPSMSRGKRGKEAATPAVPLLTAATIKGKKQKLRHLSTQRKDYEKAPTPATTTQHLAKQTARQQRSTDAAAPADGLPAQQPSAAAACLSASPSALLPSAPSSSSPLLQQSPSLSPAGDGPLASPSSSSSSNDVSMQDAAPPVAAPPSQAERSLRKAEKQRNKLESKIARLHADIASSQQQQQQQQAGAAAPAPAAPAPPAPASAAAGAAQGSAAKPARKQRVMHSRGDTLRHGLSTPSSTDLVLTIDTPPGGRCDLLHRIHVPGRSNSNDQARRWVAQLLGDRSALAIPAPRLCRWLSYSTVQTFSDLDALTSSPAAAHHLSPAEHAYFTQAATRRSSDDEGDERGYLCSGTLPSDSCHQRWTDFLTPNSYVLSATKSRSSNGHRLVLRLSFVNEVIFHIIRLHLYDYVELWKGQDGSDAQTTAVAAWKAITSASGACKATLSISAYVPRYETTAVSGWPWGPDGPPANDNFMSFVEPLGNVSALRDFLAAKAPHCLRWHVQDRQADTTATIQFYHERQYRTELFALDGMTSGHHGIFRPLRLHYKQREPPAVQCCSFCGEPGHSARTCPLNQNEGTDVMAGSSSSPAPSFGVCRLCYNPAPHHVCQTPPEQRHCKLCNKQGHTSFACAQYRSRWTPLAKPSASKPPNPRPLYIAASQRGATWSSVVAGPPAAAAQQPPPAPALPLHSAAHFPPLPSAAAAPGSPAPSTASLPASPAPSSPQSPSPLPAAADQLSLIASVVGAVVAQLMPQLNSMFAAAFDKLSARTDALARELQEERAARLKPHLAPLLQPPVSWAAAAPAPVSVYMSDAQPTAPPHPQPRTAPATSPHLPHHGTQIGFQVANRDAFFNCAISNPQPLSSTTSASSAVPASSLAPSALQTAGLTSAQQPASPPTYHQE